MNHKFDPKKLVKLDNPERRKILPPEEVISKMGISEGETVIDVGCGIGYFTFPLAKVVGVRGTVYALDILEEMIEEAKHRYKDTDVSALRNIQFKLSKENVLPLPDHIAEVLVMVNVFHELDESSSFLKEVKRVLKNSGKIIIVDWIKEKMEIGPPLENRKSRVEIINTLQVNGYANIESIELPPAHYLISALAE